MGGGGNAGSVPALSLRVRHGASTHRLPSLQHDFMRTRNIDAEESHLMRNIVISKPNDEIPTSNVRTLLITTHLSTSCTGI